eukprot:scaffold148535_cov20-Prasinocladus_malaysianus.AAC.1
MPFNDVVCGVRYYEWRRAHRSCAVALLSFRQSTWSESSKLSGCEFQLASGIINRKKPICTSYCSS